MRGHLTDSEMMETLGGEPHHETLTHLVGCPICRAERDRLRAALTGLAERARVQAERQEASWEQQGRQIASRLRDRPSRSLGWQWAWAPAAVGLAVVALFWFRGQTPQPLQKPDTDHALLIAVERSLQADVPVALRPAALLAGEVEHGDAEVGREAPTTKGDQS